MRHLLLPALLFSTGLSIANASAPTPGTYIREHDQGTLEIRREADNKLAFTIESIGANGHTCSPAGTIEGSLGRTDDTDVEGRCDIDFESNGSAIEVSPITDACRNQCGARGSFDGTYRIPPANCTPSARTARGEKFLALYRARQYASAIKLLDGVAAQCGLFMSWMETDQLHNDIALSQYHDGKYAQCVATIEKTIAGTMRDEEDLKNQLPPFDVDNYVEIAKAIWFNKELCRKAIARKQGSTLHATPTKAR